MAPRSPKRRWVDSARIDSASVQQFAALVDVTTDDNNKVKLPAGARALRFAGIMDMGGMPSVYPAVGDQVDLDKTGRSYTLLAGKNSGAAKTCTPGGWAVIHNTSGHVSEYVLGSGSAHLVGQFKTKYTNNEATAGVPVETDLFQTLVLQTEVITGYADSISANNTRNLTKTATENNGDYVLFVAPWDGTLRGFRLDLEQAAGNAGTFTGRVRIKTPGGAWATAQIDATDWTLTFDAATATGAEDTIGTDALASTKSLAITKGTKVGIQVDKNNAVANVSQLRGRLVFF